MLYLHNKYNIELIHGCDTHYITEQDKFNRNIFLKGKKISYGDEDSFENDYPSYEEILKSAEGASISRCILVPNGGGYFEGVKAVGDFSDEKIVRERTRAILDDMRGENGFIFNLGHGILPEAKPENVAAMLDEICSAKR